MNERCYCGDPECPRCYPRFETREEREYDPDSIMGIAEDMKTRCDEIDRLLKPEQGPWEKTKWPTNP